MKLIEIYHCLCDETRLRILNLLSHGPLCVCHFQDILGIRQVNVSKHLNYLKKHGLAESHRLKNWIIYSLPAKPNKLLKAHLQCLQDCLLSEKLFRDDMVALRRFHKKTQATPCATPRPSKMNIPINNPQKGPSSYVSSN